VGRIWISRSVDVCMRVICRRRVAGFSLVVYAVGRAGTSLLQFRFHRRCGGLGCSLIV